MNNEDTTSNGFYTDNEIVISFDLTNGQAINLNEVTVTASASFVSLLAETVEQHGNEYLVQTCLGL